VSVIFYFQLLFDMALFLILLSDSVTLILTAHTVHAHYLQIIVLGTLLLIFLTLIGLNMTTVVWFSVVGTITTICMCAMLIVSCSYDKDNLKRFHQQERLSSILSLLYIDIPETKSASSTIASSTLYFGYVIYKQLRVFGILR
jgi:hypothetical protein